MANERLTRKLCRAPATTLDLIKPEHSVLTIEACGVRYIDEGISSDTPVRES